MMQAAGSVKKVARARANNAPRANKISTIADGRFFETTHEIDEIFIFQIGEQKAGARSWQRRHPLGMC